MCLTFDSVQSAQRAKASLNGADIYSGCCTLKIEYAKVGFGTHSSYVKLWVVRNLTDFRLCCLVPAAYTLECVQE